MSLADFMAELDAQQPPASRQQQPAPSPVASGGDVAGGDPSEDASLAGSSPPDGTGSDPSEGSALPPTQALKPAEQPPTTWGARLRGILAAVPRVPGNIAGGLLDLGGDSVRANPLAAQMDKAGGGDKPGFIDRLRTGSTLAGSTPLASLAAIGYAFNGQAADTLSFKSTLGQVGDPTWNHVSTEILSLAVGTWEAKAAMEVTRLPELARGISSTGLRTGAQAFLAASEGAAALAVLMNPEQERFSNVLQTMGLHTTFTDYLAHDGEESRGEGRWKNAVEGVLTGVAAEGMFRVGRYWYKALKGDTAAADAVASEIGHGPPQSGPQETITEVTPEEAHSLSTTDRTAAGAATEAKPSGPITWEQSPDGSLQATFIPKEGEAGAPRSGGTGGVGGGGAGKPGGTGAGTGAGQAPADTPPDAILFKFSPGGGATEEGARIVGSTTKHDLQALGEDISIWRATTEFAGRGANDVTSAIAPDAAGRVGNFKLSPLGSADNVAPLLRAFVDRLPDTAKRSDVDLMRTVAAVSKDIGEDPNALTEAARLISGKLQDADVAMATLRSVWARAAKDIDELNIPGTDWASIGDEDFAEAAQAVHNMTTLSTYVQNAKQALGRGLRVNQLPDADAYLGSLAKDGEDVAPLGRGNLSPLPRTKDELKDWMDLWGATKGDPNVRAKMLTDLLTVPTPGMYLRTAFANQFTANILSGPKTLLIHLIGPALLNTVRTVERLSGATVGALSPFATAEERAAKLALAKSTIPAYFGSLTDLGSVFKQAWQSAQEGESVLGGLSGGYSEQLGRMGPLTENLLRAAGTEPDWRYTAGNLINVWPRTLSRTLTGLNEFSKQVVYRNEVRVRAMMGASEQGLSGDAAHSYVRDQVASAYDEVGHATNEGLLRAAEQTTLTASPGAEGSWVRKFTSGLVQLRQDIPELRYLIPVFNVPANGLGQTLSRLPIAFIPGFGRLFPETQSALAGDLGPVAQAEAHGRFMTGAAMLTAGILMNRAGILTGAGPEHPTDRKVWLMEHQPYSIRIGDSWASYDRIEVLGGLLSIPATIADATVNRHLDKPETDLLLSGAAALAEWFRDRASLQNAAGLLGVGDSPMNNVGAFASKFMGNTIQGLLVPRALTSMATNTTDPIARMKEGWTDYLRGALPGLSQTLEPVRSVLGEPVNRAADTFFDNLFPTVIAPANAAKHDPVVDELDRIYRTVGYAAGADPHNIGFGFFNPKQVALEDGRSIYDHAMQARQVMRVNGYTLRESLQALFESGEYRNAVDADPGQQRTSLGDASRGYMVKHVFDTYNDAIKGELASYSNRANGYLTAASAKQRDDAYLNDVSADALVANPSIYQARGINADAYSGKLQSHATGALAEALGVHQ